jgi:hypothetical protein
MGPFLHVGLRANLALLVDIQNSHCETERTRTKCHYHRDKP